MDRFTKRHGSTYNCNCCGKKTRETGEGESGLQMCAACYWDGQIDICGWDNEFPADILAQFHARRDLCKPNTPNADTKTLRQIYTDMWNYLNGK